MDVCRVEVENAGLTIVSNLADLVKVEVFDRLFDRIFDLFLKEAVGSIFSVFRLSSKSQNISMDSVAFLLVLVFANTWRASGIVSQLANEMAEALPRARSVHPGHVLSPPGSLVVRASLGVVKTTKSGTGPSGNEAQSPS